MKEQSEGVANDRIPPGQYISKKWPVLHVGPLPSFDPLSWDFQIFGLVEQLLRLTYQEFIALPRVKVIADMHCVTAWSTFDNEWEGVATRDLMKLAEPKPEARFVVTHAEFGYTTNLPLEVFLGDDCLFAYTHSGKPLALEHGFPLRLVIPKRYAWKSAKWVRGVELLAEDRPAFWEMRGYNNNADPWKEERYW